MSAKLEAALPSLYFLNPIIFYGRGLPLLSGSGMRYTPFRNESARIEPLGQESCQRAYRCATRFGGSPKKPPAFMWRSRHYLYFEPVLAGVSPRSSSNRSVPVILPPNSSVISRVSRSPVVPRTQNLASRSGPHSDNLPRQISRFSSLLERDR